MDSPPVLGSAAGGARSSGSSNLLLCDSSSCFSTQRLGHCPCRAWISLTCGDFHPNVALLTAEQSHSRYWLRFPFELLSSSFDFCDRPCFASGRREKFRLVDTRVSSAH